MSKISIRFYNDREVRAIWDEENAKWWFSVVDIVGSITKSENPNNYWKVYKSRLKKNNPQLVTMCNQLKLTSSDGKKYLTDTLDSDGVKQLVTLRDTLLPRLMSGELDVENINI